MKLSRQYILILILYIASNVGNAVQAESSYIFPLFEWCESKIEARKEEIGVRPYI